MAITNFIPTVWSENLYNHLNNNYVAVANCSRAWEGEIKKYGDRVKICSVGPVSIFDYKKNSNLPAPAVLTDSAAELEISQAKAFNFLIDDIDKAQAKPALMDMAVRRAADALADTADHYVFSLYDTVSKENTFDVTEPTEQAVMDAIMAALLKLQQNGVSDGIVLEVTPEIAAIILKLKMNLSTDNSAALENGCIGSIAGCKIYVSRNVNKESQGEYTFHKCLMRTKNAIAFAEQLSEIEAYRPELRFADAVKGLHLYGAKIVRPEEIMLINIINSTVTVTAINDEVQ